MIHDGSGKLEKINSKKEEIPKLSTWEVTQQNFKIKQKSEVDKIECRTLQILEKSIQ